MAGRWDPCVSHRGAEVNAFVDDYFARPERRILLVGGAGFDPRSTAVARSLANTAGQIRGLFFQEERPRPIQTLVEPSPGASRRSARWSMLVAVSLRSFEASRKVQRTQGCCCVQIVQLGTNIDGCRNLLIACIDVP